MRFLESLLLLITLNLPVIGSVPFAMAADGDASAKTAPLTLRQAIPLPLTGSLNHLAADAKRERFFLTAPAEKKVVVVDLKAGKVLRVLSDVPASAACFISELDQLCLSGAGGVAFFEGDSLAPLGRVDLNSSVDELRYDRKDRRLYAGLMDRDRSGIAILDAPGRKLLGTIKLPSKPQGFAVEENGPRAYANTPGVKQVVVLDRQKQSVVAQWSLTDAQSNYPMALDERNHRLFVGCRRPARLLVFDTSSGNVVATVGSGEDADDMAFDPSGGRIYLACGTGVISTVVQTDPGHYKRLPDTPTAPGARNALFVPELKALYVGVPGEGATHAELRVYQPRD